MPTKADRAARHTALTVTEIERIKRAQHTIETRTSVLVAANESLMRADECQSELYEGIHDLLMDINREAHAIALIFEGDPEGLE